VSVEALLAVLAAAAGVCLVVGLPRLLAPDLGWLEQRLRQYGARPFELTDEEQRKAASVQVTHLIAHRIEASVAGHTFAAALSTELAQANLRVSIGEFLIFQASVAVTAAALAFFISRTYPTAVMFAMLGWFLPKVWIGRRQSARVKAFNDQLADTIQLMSNSLRSGLSLVQAMEMISREAEPPIADEFQRVVREIGLGVGPQQALRSMVRRIASDDVDLLVTAILVQFEIGGNLSRILDSISNTIRERVKLHGEIRTLSAQGRMSGYILSCLPIAVGGLLLLVAPGYMGKLFTPGPWLALPVVAAIGIILGMIVMRQLVAIEV
jgi:tight adherence protein B